MEYGTLSYGGERFEVESIGFEQEYEEVENVFGQIVCVGNDQKYTFESRKLSEKDGIVQPFDIEKVIYNDPATIVLWKDGTKTVVMCGEYDYYDAEKGLLLCIAKKAYGNNGRFNDVIREHAQEEEDVLSPESLADVINAFNDAIFNAAFGGERDGE
jgi:hypothetical protein